MISKDPAELLASAQSGSRAALARLLSFVEAGGALHRETVQLVYRYDSAYVIGITGPPGAGKSTLTDRLIVHGFDVGAAGAPLSDIAIVCVDPSSPLSGGAILGDRIRMQDHATDHRVYIRSLATRGHLGGLALAVPDALRVLGACGFGVVIVETVGVGQMEVDIASAADTTVVVTNPGWGDSMQANKAGLLEVADLFVINKADRSGVRETRRDLELMLDLGRPATWRPPIIETVASQDTGVAALWTAINEHRAHLVESHEIDARRERRVRRELERVIAVHARQRAKSLASGPRFEDAVAAVLRGDLDPYRASDELLNFA